jgi:hypothetical protein
MHKIEKLILDNFCIVDEKNCIKRYFKKLIRILIPHICGLLIERYTDEKIEKIKKYEYKIKEDEDLNNLIKILKDYSKKENDRDNVINDKVKSSLFVIVISITFLAGIFKFLDSINLMSELLMSIGLIYLFFSGITAVQSILPRKYHNVIIKDKIKVDQTFLNCNPKSTIFSPVKIKSEENKDFKELFNYFEICTFKDRKKEASELYKSIILNDEVILKKINYMDVTFHGIILGTLFITASFIIILFINLIQNLFGIYL